MRMFIKSAEQNKKEISPSQDSMATNQKAKLYSCINVKPNYFVLLKKKSKILLRKDSNLLKAKNTLKVILS
jgi:hypothetical protein